MPIFPSGHRTLSLRSFEKNEEWAFFIFNKWIRSVKRCSKAVISTESRIRGMSGEIRFVVMNRFPRFGRNDKKWYAVLAGLGELKSKLYNQLDESFR